MKPEGFVKRAVEDLLKAERIRYWRMNSGDRFGSHNGKKWRIRGHAKGTPDFLAAIRQGLHDPSFVWIECKAPGESPSKEQLQFADEARENYEVWLCVDDVKILQDWLKENKAR